MTISTESIVRRIESVPFTSMGDERLAIDAPRGFLYSLNEPAGRAWDLMQEPIAARDVCAALLREYAVGQATCVSDVIKLLESLHEAGLVEVVE